MKIIFAVSVVIIIFFNLFVPLVGFVSLWNWNLAPLCGLHFSSKTVPQYMLPKENN